jgi:hypothetical protein
MQRKKKKRTPQLSALIIFIILLALFSVVLSACGGGNMANNNAANDNNADVGDDNVADDDSDDEPVEDPDYPPPTPRPTGTPRPEKRIEDWLVDLEWPDSIFLGESDVIRLTMVPSETGLTIEAEFSDHQSVSKEVPIERPTGYLLNAVADLQSPTFEISPSGPQSRELVPGKSETWHWSISPEEPGRHRLFLMIKMEWIPLEANLPSEREFGVISHAFEIQVDSYYGLSRAQANLLLISAGTILILAVVGLRVQKAKSIVAKNIIQEPSANPEVLLEPKPEITLTDTERTLLQTVFRKYARVVVEKEFMSGYSGARTFMTTPILANQRADAYSIIKISGRESINREFHNYQAYVKNTLPPTTARIQEAPISVKQVDLAALRYTFIGAPGNLPQSLRLIMQQNPDPRLFELLASGYGPSWWLQRTPYTFRLSQEYDRKLPAHYVIRPAQGKGKIFDGRLPSGEEEFKPGDIVRLKHFRVRNINPTRSRISLLSESDQDGVPIKVTYLSSEIPKEYAGEIVTSRETLLKESTSEFNIFGLPNPLDRLPALLNQTITGSRSIIHGDLNLENILIGPGDIIWLIDFAETREGHTLFDFAHLYTEIIAHLLSGHFPSPAEYLEKLSNGQLSLLSEFEAVVQQFLFNPGEVREFKLAAAISCLGALKYTNLDAHAKYLLYLTAANLIDTYL